MTDFKPVRGFEDAERSDRTRFRLTPTTLKGEQTSQLPGSSRLARIVNHAPQVIVSVSSRVVGRPALREHLKYVSRDGQLALEDRDGNPLIGRSRLFELAEDWTEQSQLSRSRISAATSLTMVLAMPPPTDAAIVQDAARAFARKAFQDRFDYVFVLHTDASHPHVHMAVRLDGRDRTRLNPFKPELHEWRRIFAEALRERGVEAEATPRIMRGLTRKGEHPALRRIRLKFEAGLGEPARNLRDAYEKAARAAFFGETELTEHEVRIVEMQRQIRQAYRERAELLRMSPDPADQKLGREVEAFVKSMPAPDSQRLALARELRAANERTPERYNVGQYQRDRREKDLER